MREDSRFQDTDFLRNDQYRDARKLNARGELHRRFSTNEIGWHRWVFEQLQLRPGDEVLECGCGPGWLWQERTEILPEGCVLTLSDMAPGMIADARNALGSAQSDIRYLVADIEALPFDEMQFELIVANHMLYHVPNKERAMAEVGRVLRPDGRFYAATNGRDHMVELSVLGRNVSRHLGTSYEQPLGQETVAAFGLENGQEELERWFKQVHLIRYSDSLEVTEVSPIVDYLESLTGAEYAISDAFREEVSRHVDQVISERGAYHITKSSGMFLATGFRSHQIGSSKQA